MSSRGNGRRIAGRNSSAQNDLSGSAGARSGVSSPEQRPSRHQPAMSLRPGGIFERTGMARSRAGHRNAAASRRPRWQWEDRAIASGGNRTFASGRSSYNLDFVDMENEWENFENEDYDMEYYSGNSSDEGEDENLKSYEEDYIAFWKTYQTGAPQYRLHWLRKSLQLWIGLLSKGGAFHLLKRVKYPLGTCPSEGKTRTTERKQPLLSIVHAAGYA